MSFNKPLNAHLRTKYTEHFTFSVVKHCFPEQYQNLQWEDAPDLQMPDKSIGIEITVAVSPETAQIDGEFTKYRVGKQSAEDKEKCKELIERNGGSLWEIGLNYPVQTQEGEQTIFRNAIQRKLKKLASYRQKGFQRIGLLMFFDELPIPPFNLEKDWLAQFDQAQENSADKFDFLYFLYPYALLCYDFQTKECNIVKIGSEAYDELSKNARLAVEK